MRNLFIVFFLFTYLTTFSQVSDFESINFEIADNTAKLHEGNSLDNLPILSYELTHNLTTDVEKFRSIFYWVCHNINGDDTQDTKVTNKRKKLFNDSIAYKNWNNQHKEKFFKRLFKQKKTVCTGYAYLIKELCFFAKIECKMIDGYGRNIEANVESLDLINHTWNEVKLNNKWYLCDATWASGYSDEKGNFIKEFNEGYFLASPDIFYKNHILINQFDFYQNNKKLPPLVYGEALKYDINPIYPKELSFSKTKNEEFNLEFTSNNNLNLDLIYVAYQLRAKEIKIPVLELNKNEKNYKIKLKFNSKGKYDIHIKYKNEYIYTYIVTIN